MALLAAFASALCASCSSSPAPSERAAASASPRPAPPRDAPDAAPDAAADEPPGAPWDPFPTLRSAGAASCKITRVISLGPSTSDHPVAGFGTAGGLAAFRQDEARIALQRLAADGAAVGAAVTVPLDAARSVDRIYALERAFIVLLRLWDWQKADVRWWGLVVSREGQPREPPVELGLSDMDIRVDQTLDGQRVALLLMPAAIATKRASLRGRWQTLILGAGGALESKATEVNVDDLGTLSTEAWEPAELAGARGWVVLREGALRPEGVFAGKRASSAFGIYNFFLASLRLAFGKAASSEGT